MQQTHFTNQVREQLTKYDITDDIKAAEQKICSVFSHLEYPYHDFRDRTNHKRKYVETVQIAVWLIWKSNLFTHRSVKNRPRVLGKLFNYNRTTIFYHLNAINDRIDTEPELRGKLVLLNRFVNGKG